MIEHRVTVLRLGHRLVRDTRTSTHAALVSRALGASRIIMTGAEEEDTLRSIERVNSHWGGNFRAEYAKNWREIVKNWEGPKVHLTMYGERLDKALPRISKGLARKNSELLVIVGAEKVPREIYSLVDYNVSVGTQPHSEVGALAVFLDRFFRGEELYCTFSNAQIRIVPSKRAKRVRKTK